VIALREGLELTTRRLNEGERKMIEKLKFKNFIDHWPKDGARYNIMTGLVRKGIAEKFEMGWRLKTT
jgi:hypothetical protein